MRRVALLVLLLGAVTAGLILLARAPGDAAGEGGGVRVGVADPEPTLHGAAEELRAPSPLVAEVAVAGAPVAAAPPQAWHGLVLDAQDRPLEAASIGRVPAGRPVFWFFHGPPPRDPTLFSDSTWVLTDARGRFEMPYQPPLRVESWEEPGWLLVVRHPRGVAWVIACKDDLERGGDVGTIRLAPGGTVRGRVLAADGAPAVDAEVIVKTPLSVKAFQGARSSLVGLPDNLLGVRTAADGSFAIGGVPACEATVQVEAEGHLLLQPTRRPLPEGGEVDLGVLRLERGGTVSGRVLDAQGQPVAGAEVRATRDELEQVAVHPHGIHLQLDVARAGEVRIGEQHEARACVTRSGPDGRFEIGSIETPICSVLADAPGHEPAAIGDVVVGASDLVLRLGALGQLRLRVTGEPGGAPVTDATLSVQHVPSFDFSVGPDQDVVDMEGVGPGEFLWRSACGSPLRVTVASPTWGAAVFHVNGLGAGETDASREIRLRRPASVRGRVTGTDGQPLPDAKVTLGPYGDDPILALLPRRDLVVTAEASFESGPVAAGHWAVRVSVAGRAAVRREVWLDAGRAEDTGDLALPRLARVLVRLLDADGRPVPKAWLSLQNSGFPPGSGMALASEQTDADGRAVMDAAPGAARLELHEPLVLMDLGTLTEGETREVSMSYQPAARLSGTVRDADGPVADAEVEFLHSLGSAQATTDSGGRWSLEVAGGLTGSVSVRTSRGGLVQRSVSTVPGEAQIVDIVLGSGKLRGRVVDGAGRAGLPGILVYAEPAAGPPHGRPVKSDAEGRFEIGDLEDGEWAVHANRADFTVSERLFVHVPPAAGEELTLSVTAFGSVRGTVRTSVGHPVTVPCSVRLFGAGENTGAWDATGGKAGTYEFLRVAPGDYELVVTRFSVLDGENPRRQDIEPLAWRLATVHVEPGASVEQDFILPPGRP